MSGMDIGRHFERLAQFREISDWSAICDNGPGGQIHQSSQRAMTVVRATLMDEAPLEQLLAVSRPEFQCGGSAPAQDPFNRRIAELLAPGDAVIEWSGMNEGLSSEEAQSYRILGFMSGGGDLTQPSSMRVAVWRDFPAVGEFSAVYTSVLSNTGYYTWSSSFGDGSVSITEHFMEIPWPTCPDWWIPMLQEFLEATSRRCALMTHPTVLALAGSVYVVACLRSCTHGPPLLPINWEGSEDSSSSPPSVADNSAIVQMDAYTWAQAKREGFNFPTYLQNLLRFAGCHNRCVFDRLDGRKVAPYQAVIRCSEWELVQESFHKLFRLQQSAYRRMYGGKSAPRVYFGTKPSFLDLSAEAPQVLDLILHRKTFVEWMEVSPTSSPVSAEFP